MAQKPPRKPPSPAFSGRKALIPILAVLILVAAAVGLWCFRAAFPRLEVAGFRISEAEYLRAMYQARNDVLSEHAAAGISLKDWGTETALGDPCGLTTGRALEILQEYYAIETLAAERGYLADVGYDAMLEELADVNRRRQEALDAGQIVTGTLQFTVDNYITYRASNIRLKFCSDPDNPEYPVTPEEILRRYEADRDDLYVQADSMELAFLAVDDADDGLIQAFHQAREKGDLAAALEENPGLAAYYQEISVNPGSYGIYARSHGDILADAAELPSGGLSQVILREGRLYLIQCIRRTDHEYVSLEEIQSLVVQSIRESRYDDLIAARTEQMEISGSLRALYRFTAEQLH